MKTIELVKDKTMLEHWGSLHVDGVPTEAVNVAIWNKIFGPIGKYALLPIAEYDTLIQKKETEMERPEPKEQLYGLSTIGKKSIHIHNKECEMKLSDWENHTNTQNGILIEAGIIEAVEDEKPRWTWNSTPSSEIMFFKNGAWIEVSELPMNEIIALMNALESGDFADIFKVPEVKKAVVEVALKMDEEYEDNAINAISWHDHWAENNLPTK